MSEISIASDSLGRSLSIEARTLVAPFLGVSDPQDNELEVYDLERRSQTLKLLRSLYTPVKSNRDRYVLGTSKELLLRPQHIGSQFARIIIPTLIDYSPDEGLDKFRSIEAQTEDQHTLLTTTDEQFQYVHKSVAEYLANNSPRIRASVRERFCISSLNGHENHSAFINNDRYQFAEKETRRSLGNLMLNGLVISVDEKGLPILTKANEGLDGNERPLIDSTKNWPILTINGFEGSKLSLAIHDAIDHGWTFALADRLGLLDKYDQFFQSIGTPHKTDIFKREGEILASIAFGARYWENQKGFLPILGIDFIISRMELLKASGHITDRHSEALVILKDLSSNTESKNSQSLGFVLSNYIATLHEQRRRYGKIKQRDLSTDQVTQELNPLSADHMCFMIELHDAITNPINNHEDNLYATHLLLEDFLTGIGSGRYPNDYRLEIDINNSSENDLSSLDISEEKQHWLKRHFKFSSIKEEVNANE